MSTMREILTQIIDEQADAVLVDNAGEQFAAFDLLRNYGDVNMTDVEHENWLASNHVWHATPDGHEVIRSISGSGYVESVEWTINPGWE